MSEKIGLGFVGCGKHGLRSHGDLAAEMADTFEIVSAFDLNPEAVENFAKLNPNLHKASTSADLVNNLMVNAVVIATPPQFHLEVVEQALVAGKHVLCEKPLWSNNSLLGQQLVQAMFQKRLVFTSCHPRRFDPPYLFIKDVLPRFVQGFGKLRNFNFTFAYHKAPEGWRKKDSLLLDHLNHELDMLNFMVGFDSVLLDRVYDRYDQYNVIGRTSEGVGVSFSGSKHLEEKVYRNRLGLVFQKGTITLVSVLSEGLVRSIIEVDGDGWGDGPEIIYSSTHTATEPFRGIMRSFANAILGKGPNYLTKEEMIMNTLACTELLEHGVCRIVNTPRP